MKFERIFVCSSHKQFHPAPTPCWNRRPLRFVITATEPCFAAFRAKVSPAMPLPITTKSYSFMGGRILSISRVSPKKTARARSERGSTITRGCRSSAPTISA